MTSEDFPSTSEDLPTAWESLPSLNPSLQTQLEIRITGGEEEKSAKTVKNQNNSPILPGGIAGIPPSALHSAPEIPCRPNADQKVKVLAAERRTTLRDIIARALQQWMRTLTEDEKKKRKATKKPLLRAMRASNTAPMKPLTREEIYDR